MRALAIDTSTHRAEVALWDGRACVARAQNLDPATHAEALLALVDRTFADAGWRKTELDLLVPGLGPGSFTGVRVGLATAKGIALALDRPMVGLSGLEAMASAARGRAPGANDAGAVLALLDARKGEVFWAAYGTNAEPLGGPGHIAAHRLGEVLEALPARTIVVGEFAATGIEGLPALPGRVASIFRSPETDLPDAAELARLGVRAFERRGPDDMGALEPIYVRPPDITLPRPK